jgi:hypothetical protein
VRRALALAVCLAFAPLAARAELAPQLEYSAPAPAPGSFAPLGWRYGDKLSVGYWYSAEQVLRIDQRIGYLEQRAAKECVDAQVSASKGSLPLWVGVALGAVGGLAAGYAAARLIHR